MRVLVTGGAGFVGHHLVEHIIRNRPDWHITVLDKLSYASDWDRLRDVGCFSTDRVTCLSGTFTEPVVGGLAREIGEQDHILHLGAESHVDNSIADPLATINANIVGTHHMLQLARTLCAHFWYFSTDEVFGPAAAGTAYGEWDKHRPMNPYAATKSAAESLVRAYGNTYGIRWTITRSMNIMGERQHPEKYIPLVIRNVLAGAPVKIHADPTRKFAGVRSYIHARNVADALLFLSGHADAGAEWHIVGEQEIDNLALAQMIADIIEKPLRYEMVDFHSSRPGHDLRYALDGYKLAALGWAPPKTFAESLEKTVRWTLANQRWL